MYKYAKINIDYSSKLSKDSVYSHNICTMENSSTTCKSMLTYNFTRTVIHFNSLGCVCGKSVLYFGISITSAANICDSDAKALLKVQSSFRYMFSRRYRY